MESMQPALPRSRSFRGVDRFDEADCASDVGYRRVSEVAAERISTALVIDSDALMRLAVSDILRRDLGVETVLAVASVKQARSLVHAARASLVLVDASLLGRNSISSIVPMQAGPQCPVIVFVDDCDVQRAARWLEEGAAAVLDRRVNHSGFREAIARVERGERFCSVVSQTPRDRWANTATLERRARDLRPRQRQILRMIAEGARNRDIALALGLCEPTVKAHVQSIFSVLTVVNRTRAAICANWLIKGGLL